MIVLSPVVEAYTTARSLSMARSRAIAVGCSVSPSCPAISKSAMARIRAIESDRAVVYASTTGESTIIGPDGAVIERSGVWRQAILDARVPLVSYRTLADRVGAWPEYVLVLLTVLGLGFSVTLRRRLWPRGR